MLCTSSSWKKHHKLNDKVCRKTFSLSSILPVRMSSLDPSSTSGGTSGSILRQYMRSVCVKCSSKTNSGIHSQCLNYDQIKGLKIWKSSPITHVFPLDKEFTFASRLHFLLGMKEQTFTPIHILNICRVLIFLQTILFVHWFRVTVFNPTPA